MGTARLMRQKHSHQGIRWCAAQGKRRVTAVRLIKMMGREVIDACQHQRSTGLRVTVMQHHMLVHQHGQPQPAQLGNPGVGS